MNSFDSSEDPPIDPEALEALSRSLKPQVESALVRELEEHLGRVPSDDEVSTHGSVNFRPDGSMEFTWKGETFLEMDALITGDLEG